MLARAQARSGAWNHCNSIQLCPISERCAPGCVPNSKRIEYRVHHGNRVQLVANASYDRRHPSTTTGVRSRDHPRRVGPRLYSDLMHPLALIGGCVDAARHTLVQLTKAST
eukprot:6195907-Pleurochrysis_carterae.AAC.3